MSDDDFPSGRPTWFGPDASPLFGVVHVPSSGRARAGIVICPPVGKEQVDTYRGLKFLAQDLCARGFAVLRFDYPGTGDSARNQRLDSAIPDYRQSIQTAVTYLRDSGVSEVGLVGLRLGALLASQAASTLGELTSLVLWDPVTDGRRYLRQQRALYKMTVGEDVVDVDAESILGISFSSSAALDLSALTLPTAIDATTAVLAAVRSEHRDDARLAALADASNCAIVDIEGQAKFVEPFSFLVEIPVEAVSAIATWLDSTMSKTAVPVSPPIELQAIVAGAGTRRPVMDTLQEFGPNRLFAIRTAAVDVTDDPPTLLIHNTSSEHRVGSGRIWTEMARELAAMGIAVVRYDRRGTGETGVATPEFAKIFSQASKTDALHAMIGTGVGPERLIMTGICSGAWNSAYGAIRRGARCVVLLNINVYRLRRVEVGAEKLIGVLPLPLAGAPLLEPRTAKAIVKKFLRRWLPYPAWRLAGSLGLATVPGVLLKRLQHKGIRTEMILSPADYEWFDRQRGRQCLARLARTGPVPSIAVAPSGDHPLLQRDTQNFARRQLTQTVALEFGAEMSASRKDGHDVKGASQAC